MYLESFTDVSRKVTFPERRFPEIGLALMLGLCVNVKISG